jgi:hypothetical protein
MGEGKVNFYVSKMFLNTKRHVSVEEMKRLCHYPEPQSFLLNLMVISSVLVSKLVWHCKLGGMQRKPYFEVFPLEFLSFKCFLVTQHKKSFDFNEKTQGEFLFWGFDLQACR